MKKFQTPATTWMQLEGVMLSETRWSQKHTRYMTSLRYLEQWDSERQCVQWWLPEARGKVK